MLSFSTKPRCYDPLGLVGPTITKAILILQRMWRDKLQWDESLPQSQVSAIFNRLESLCSQIDIGQLQSMDEYNLKVHLESFNNLESCFGIA